jgi:hypothetical protein
MRIVIGPAKRPGKSREIFSLPLTRDDISVQNDDVLMISIVGEGVNSDGSSYRYDFCLTRPEVALINEMLPTDRGGTLPETEQAA